nr:hypothetical protein [uncultured Carboxylicivirga sp.]
MSTILAIDKSQRKNISIIFRVFLIGYSIFILLYSGTEFKWYINVAAFLLYVFLYGFLYKKDKLFSLLRLINDYAFITFILIQSKNIDIFSFALLFAPILNTHNHSGERKSILLYVFPLISLYVVTSEFKTLYIIPFILFFFINSFDSLRSKYFRFQQRLNTVIDNFFIDDKLYTRPYKIYENVIPIFNESGILRREISKIVCLRVENDKFIIVNGSYFVWNFEIKDKKSFFDVIKEKRTIYNVKMEIDGDIINNNIVQVCPINSHLYCYILFSNDYKNLQHIPLSFFVPKLLSPFFHRLSKVFDADIKQKSNELKKLSELEDKINYVTNSVNSMHFIRNKLGPVKSYLAMVDDYNRSSDETKRRKIEPYLQRERQKLSASISQILERADYILTKSNNPFNVYQTNTFGIQQLFSEIRRVWGYYFDFENFEINWLTNKDRIKYDVKYNIVGLELVLNNWISNMYKYNKGVSKIVFDEDEDNYSVIFINSFDSSNPNSTKFIEDFESSQRVEIERRNSRGLLEVKDFISQMNISAKMTHTDGDIYFKLQFKKYIYNENINN